MADTTTAPTTDNALKGIAYLALGVVIFTVQDVIVKDLSGAYPIHEMLFIRSVVGFFPLAAAIALTVGFEGFRVQPAAVLRGVVHFFSYSVYYLALASLPLAETVTLYYTNPLIITALSVPFLGESVGWRRWSAVGVGFVGVVVVLQPGVTAIEPAMLLALLSAFFYGVSMLITRRNAKKVTAASFAIHSMVILALAAGLSGLVIGDGRFDLVNDGSAQFLLRAWTVPNLHDFLLLASCGLIAAIAFYLLSQAYRVAPASVVTPFEYSSLPVAVLFGYLVWGDLPAPATWAGLALIVGAGLYIVHREAVQGRKVVRGWPPMRPRL
jgi:S-adenosylmethionine uptake transporter